MLGALFRDNGRGRTVCRTAMSSEHALLRWYVMQPALVSFCGQRYSGGVGPGAAVQRLCVSAAETLSLRTGACASSVLSRRHFELQ